MYYINEYSLAVYVSNIAPLTHSFGLSAVFLIAGLRRDTRAQPIYIRTGDIVIMAGRSRLAYHGVPRVIDNDGQGSEVKRRYHDEEEEEDEEPWKLYDDYVTKNRINFNVRQVYPN